MAANHVAILRAPYIRLILDGCKTMESRLTKTARPPYHCIAPGDRIYIKRTSGPFMAEAVAGRVLTFENLTPERVDGLHRKYNDHIHGDPDYWHTKRDSRYATLISLRQVKQIDTGPDLPPSRGPAWFVIDAPVQPHGPRRVDVVLTEGAIRNRYVRPRAGDLAAPAGKPALHLTLPDGRTIISEHLSNGMIRWRGWGRYFTDHAVTPGDIVRFTPTSPGRYSVTMISRVG